MIFCSPPAKVSASTSLLSFVILMRVAGIPARVVTGYQGGEYNEVGEYMVVRQRDAHAGS